MRYSHGLEVYETVDGFMKSVNPFYQKIMKIWNDKTINFPVKFYPKRSRRHSLEKIS